MSVLGPPPLTGIRRHSTIAYPLDRGCPRPRRADGDWPTEPAPADDRPTKAELTAVAARLNAELLGGLAPDDLEVVIGADLGANADGRYVPDTQQILVRADLTRDQAARVVAHELVHALLLSGPADMRAPADEDPHGPSFQKVAAIVDPDGAPTSLSAAAGWQPRLAPCVRHLNGRDWKPAGRLVRALTSGKISNYARKRGDQVLKFRKGDRVPADHWAVAQAPEMFA